MISITQYRAAVCTLILTLLASSALADDKDAAWSLRLLDTNEEWGNSSGGLKEGSVNVNNIDAQLTLDAEKAFGWTGGNFMLDGLYNNGKSPNSLTGAALASSPIDTGSELFRIFQAWYSQDLYDGKTNVLFGLYDVNSDFDSLDSAGLFLNGGYSWAATLDQSGLNGPSTYPNTALALRVIQKLDEKDGVSVQFAVLDGVPDNPDHPRENTINFSKKNGAFMIGEGDYQPNSGLKVLSGAWYYTAKFDEFDTTGSGMVGQSSNNAGLYAGIHKRLYKSDVSGELSGFINVGLSDGDINRFDQSLSTGLDYKGIIPSRPADHLGLAFTVAHNSSSYQEEEISAGRKVEGNEENYELTYRAKITDWLTLQPDVQYVVNPDTTPGIRNDVIFGIHLEIGHGFTF